MNTCINCGDRYDFEECDYGFDYNSFCSQPCENEWVEDWEHKIGWDKIDVSIL